MRKPFALATADAIAFLAKSSGGNPVQHQKVGRELAKSETELPDLFNKSPDQTALESQAKDVPLRFEAGKWPVEQKTRVMLGIASVILVGLNALSFWSFIKQKETTDQVAESRIVLQKLEIVLSTLKDAETGQRGYVLTGQDSYLKPYDSAVRTIKPQIQELEQLTLADPELQQQLTTLESLVTRKLAELHKTIDLRKNQGFEASVSVVLTHQGQDIMDQIRTVIQQMQEDKSQQLNSWLNEREKAARKGQLVFLAGIVLTLIAFYLVYQAIHQETVERKQAEASFKRLNEELEARVHRRTAELEEANANLLYSNRELEQFAYVASHDLQEPLRAVNSYAQLIARKYQGNFDAKADKYFGYITEGATRMQQLINDLLEFSRVGTRGRALEPTDSEAVVSQALDNLKVAIAESNAAVTHDPLPTVLGDESQLVQLFQNLISNAIKFRREEPPRVHISAALQTNEWVFAVCDNGIGMEAEYFERIFTIFQRLHSRAEYPGTGIGLAVCKKIVERHGGRIWVESTPAVGTTFHFTIPQTKQQPS